MTRKNTISRPETFWRPARSALPTRYRCGNIDSHNFEEAAELRSDPPIVWESGSDVGAFLVLYEELAELHQRLLSHVEDIAADDCSGEAIALKQEISSHLTRVRDRISNLARIAADLKADFEQTSQKGE